MIAGLGPESGADSCLVVQPFETNGKRCGVIAEI